MIVCDECRNVDAKAFDCTIILEKEEQATTKSQRLEHGTPKRMKRREVVRIPIALCEKCITKVCKSIGTMKQRGTLSKMGLETQTEEPKPTEGKQ